MKYFFPAMMICLITSGLSVAGSDRVVGYYPDWGTGRLPISQIRYDKLDHIIYFSISPNADGSIDLGHINISNMMMLVSTAHSNDVGVSICVGGWLRGQHFSAMTANATTRANFVSNMHQLCIDYGLDGVDLDWESISGDTDKSNYTKLIKDLKTALSDDGLLVTVAAASSSSKFEASAVPYLDWVNIMAYDMGTPHSSYWAAISTLTYWEDFGFPREKEFLGVPFYGRSSSGAYTYKQIMDTYAPAPDIDLVDGINFNGIDTIKAKAKYASINGYAGIMIWEISQDTSDETSLLTAIHDGFNITVNNESYRMIPPADLKATASSGQTSYPDPMVVVDGRGMVSQTEHSSSWGSWFTDGFELDRWIVVDLGDTYTLKKVHVWNANEAWGWRIYDFKDTEVYVTTAADPGNPVDNAENWTLVDTVKLTQALGELGANSPATDMLDLTGYIATHVALRALSTYKGSWGTESAGLSELQFYSVALRADIDNDNDVDIVDLQRLVSNWLDAGDNLEGDFNGDGQIDMLDLGILGEDWLKSLQE